MQQVLSGEITVEQIDTEYLGPLVNALKTDRDDKISHRKPDEAQISDQYLCLVRQRYNDWQRDNAQHMREGQIRERYRKAKQDLDDLKERFKQEDQAMREENYAKQQELVAKQQDELDRLREEWRTENKSRKYNRTSGQLKSMRRQAILLLNDHRYNEMKMVEKMADAQEAKERDEHYRSMNAEYIYAQQLLEQKHQREIEVLIHAQDGKLSEHEYKAKIDILHAERRVANLKGALQDACDPTKVWNLFHRNQMNAGGKKGGGTPRSREVPETKNYNQLTLPPLRGPLSQRRKKLSARNETAY